MLITVPCQIQLAGIPVAAGAGVRGFLPEARSPEAQILGAVLLAVENVVVG